MKFDQTRYQIFVTKQVSNLIMKKRDMSEIEALESFLNSEVYQMIVNPDLDMWEFAPLAIFDMWEHEIVTGDPRNSLYIRGDEIE